LVETLPEGLDRRMMRYHLGGFHVCRGSMKTLEHGLETDIANELRTKHNWGPQIDSPVPVGKGHHSEEGHPEYNVVWNSVSPAFFDRSVRSSTTWVFVSL
jgi:hypothetical protein